MYIRMLTLVYCILFLSSLSLSHLMNHHLHLSLSTTSCSSFLKPCFFSLAAGPAGGPSGCGGLCLARNPPGESIVKRLTMLFIISSETVRKGLLISRADSAVPLANHQIIKLLFSLSLWWEQDGPPLCKLCFSLAIGYHTVVQTLKTLEILSALH